MDTSAPILLRDGSALEIDRFRFPEDAGRVPEWLHAFAPVRLGERWQVYYQEVLAGEHPDCRDFLYVGRVNGTPCSRMWFGYSLHSGCGNFGNVRTFEEFRRRGIMRKLLEQCVADFYGTDALFLSCGAAVTAAPAYAQAGFQRIFTEDKNPMVIVNRKERDFAAILRRAYGDTAGAAIRPGTPGDRFDCDKLLAYAPEVFEKIPTDPQIPDYLTLHCHEKRENRPIQVLETRSGFCAGYAWSGEAGELVMLHPAFESYRTALLQAARSREA